MDPRCFLVVCAICMCAMTSPVYTQPVATTGVGTFSGRTTKTKTTKTGMRFLGIPYAKPPIGELRFERPEAADAVESPYNASYFRPHCAQLKHLYPAMRFSALSEDCLHLNVYVPGEVVSTSAALPVMIWIYGGSFVNGGADVYSGEVLCSRHDVIIVTFNYRMNVFGFLSDGEKSSGNLGLWDQQLAIKWVKNNIAAFGGDVTRITLFGQSAGAVSVVYQALNPDNEGLFSRIIAQSGSPLTDWAVQKSPAKKFDAFCKRAECATNCWTCLKTKTMAELLEYLSPGSEGIPIQPGPTVDLDFIKDHPTITFQQKTAASKAALDHFGGLDFLTGVLNKDNVDAIFVAWGPPMRTAGLNLNDGVSREYFEKNFLPQTLSNHLNCPATEAIIKLVSTQYRNASQPDDPKAIRDQMVDLVTDISYLVPALVAARAHSELSDTTKTYVYSFDQKSSFTAYPTWLEGAKHKTDIQYVFGFTDSIKKLNTIQYAPSAEESILSTTITKMWTNFAKSGNPTPEDSSWPVYDKAEGSCRRFFTSGSSTGVVAKNFGAAIFSFWTDRIGVGCNAVASATYVVPSATLTPLLLVLCIIIIHV